MSVSDQKEDAPPSRERPLSCFQFYRHAYRLEKPALQVILYRSSSMATARVNPDAGVAAQYSACLIVTESQGSGVNNTAPALFLHIGTAWRITLKWPFGLVLFTWSHSSGIIYLGLKPNVPAMLTTISGRMFWQPFHKVGRYLKSDIAKNGVASPPASRMAWAVVSTLQARPSFSVHSGQQNQVE